MEKREASMRQVGKIWLDHTKNTNNYLSASQTTFMQLFGRASSPHFYVCWKGDQKTRRRAKNNNNNY